MMRSAVCLMTLSAAAFSAASSQAQSVLRTLPAPPAKLFSAQLALTWDAELFLKQSAAGAEVPVAPARTDRDHPLKVMSLVSGCVPDDKGLCNVTATFAIYRSSGIKQSQTFTKRDGQTTSELPILMNQPPPPIGQWHVKEFEMVGRFVVSRDVDVTGDYLVLATFTDHNARDSFLTVWKVVRIINPIGGDNK